MSERSEQLAEQLKILIQSGQYDQASRFVHQQLAISDGANDAIAKQLFILSERTGVLLRSGMRGLLPLDSPRTRQLTRISASKDASYIAGSFRGVNDQYEKDIVVCWSVADLNQHVTLHHQRRVLSTTWLPTSNTLVSACTGGIVCLWSIPEGKLIAEYGPYPEAVMSVDVSPSGNRLALGLSDGTVRVVSATDGETLGQITLPPSLSSDANTGLVCPTFHAKAEQIYTGGKDGILRSWDANTFSEVSQYVTFNNNKGIRAHSYEVVCVACSPCGQFVASGNSNDGVRVFDVVKNEVIYEGFDGVLSISSIIFSPDSKLLAIKKPNAVVLVDYIAGSRLGYAEDNGHSTTSAFVASGKMLVTGYDIENLMLWLI